MRSERTPWIILAIAAVWAATGIAAIFSPDLVTGSAHERLPLAAITDWLWALLATGLIGLVASGHAAAIGMRWLAVSVVAIWAVVAAVSVLAPVMVTGTDPTEIPLATLLAPVAGVIATAYVAVAVATFRDERAMDGGGRRMEAGWPA